ncbi:Glycoside hydrolase [Tylopilus felleus]
MVHFGLHFFALIIGLAHCQNLSVPSTWREPENKYTLEERVAASHTAINSLLPELNEKIGYFNDLGYWQGGNVLSAMANQDHITNQRVNQAVVTTYLNKAFSLYANYSTSYNDDALWWATAAYYSYRAYGDKNLLSHAMKTWDHVKTFQISAEDAQRGSMPTKNFTIKGTCDGKTMTGGVFWRPVSSDTAVNSVTTGLFLTLSAYLAELTHNSTYTDSAIAAATWIQTLNLNSDSLALDTINANDCSRSPATELFTYNSGKLIEGLSVLVNVTHNESWQSFMLNTTAAVLHTTVWQGTNGVVTEGGYIQEDNDAVGFKSILIRPLHEEWARNPGNAQLQTIIRNYINVQYNALMELASTKYGNTTWYSPEWAGPKPANVTAWGQLAALDVLVSSIDVNPAT